MAKTRHSYRTGACLFAIIHLISLLAAPPAKAQRGTGQRAELQQSLMQRYPLTEIGPSVLGLRGDENTIRRIGITIVMQRAGLAGAVDRKQAPTCLVRGDAAELAGGKEPKPIAAGERLYIHSIYVGTDVVEFGMLGVAPQAGGARLWARVVFFVAPEILEQGDRAAVYRQLDQWFLPESGMAVPVATQSYVPPPQPAATAPPPAKQVARLESGLTREEVVKLLGEPSRDVEFGKREWLAYTGFVVLLEDGKLKSVEHGGRPGRVRIRTEPESAEIFLGDQLVGHGPSTLELPAGRYVFLVRLNGYLPWRQEVDLLAGADITLVAKLTK